MRKVWILGWMSLFFSGFNGVKSQRNYAAHSVLSSGDWYKISIPRTGVYKIDLAQLSVMGINTASLASASIRVFGNGGAMLAEANAGFYTDDLLENTLKVVDGGDGILNNADFILFFGMGPEQWTPDPVNQRFSHRKNLFSDQAYYFINIGGNGRRINTAPIISSPVVTVNSFSERYFHEIDSINFLSGSKEWYGEEMSALPGRSLSKNFSIDFFDLPQNAPVTLQSNLVARSVGVGSRFDIRLNNQPAAQVSVNPVGNGIYDLVAQPANNIAIGVASQNKVEVTFTYVPGSFNAQGWLNWYEIFTRRNLSLHNTEQLPFRDWNSVGNSTAEFIIGNATNMTEVWDVTDGRTPQQMTGNFSGNSFRFVNTSSTLKEYVAFVAANLPRPGFVGKISTQDIHSSAPKDYIIITHPTLLSQANRLAEIHTQHSGLRTLVLTTDQVFNEFASGSPDPTALKDFVKMYHDKYGSSSTDKLKYLLLFGDASFDYKQRILNNTNLVPAYQNNLALDPLSSHTSDDFFGFLDDQEDINSGLVLNLLDVAIGRIPARNATEAKNFVDKLAAYLSPQSLGPWRSNISFVADDEDNNLHLQDAEQLSATATMDSFLNQQKIYLDAFRQEGGAGGGSYPQAEQLSNNQLYNGTLIWNYSGHGGPARLAEETILDQSVIDNLKNENRLPLFITATCDFAPFDQPNVRSLGENILQRPKTGGIALLTTTRIVFSASNRFINDNYLRVALEADANGKHRSVGEALRVAKNFTYQNSGDVTNNRKFTLLGDPALTLGFPTLRVKTLRVNGVNASSSDTLSSTEKVVIEGEVTDIAGNRLSNFNGTVYPTVFDKPQTIQTLANDPGSQVTDFQTQTNVLFKGKSSVTNGVFSFAFRMPRDINFQYGKGKLSLYADDGTKDAAGLFKNVVIGGVGNADGADNEGPEIKLHLNDSLFANGGVTNQQPILLVKLADSSGINTAGIGIGHELIATLDNDNRQFFILNDFYQAALNSYQQGEVRFQLPELPAGPHSIKVKAWDVMNNSAEAVIEFIVAKDEELQLTHVLNYPNPFTTNTTFFFEHNKPAQPLRVHLEIMTITGRIIKSFSRTIVTDGNRSADISWDGKDDYGSKIGRGTYLYKLRVIAPDGKKKEVIEKLVIL